MRMLAINAPANDNLPKKQFSHWNLKKYGINPSLNYTKKCKHKKQIPRVELIY